ncbi:MAG: hypothetical protein IPI07_17140 [Flavobacteriales bacterium]|nr:hypothetical protein [Flavobacteriales bacterium]
MIGTGPHPWRAVLFSALLPVWSTALPHARASLNDPQPAAQPLDTALLAQRLRQVDVIMDVEPDSAFAILHTLPSVTHEPWRSSVRARSYEVVARREHASTQLLSALAYCDSAIERYNAMGDQRSVGRVTHLKGNGLVTAGDFTGASEALEEALAFFTMRDDMVQVAGIRASLGAMHYFQRQFERAWEHYHASLALYQTAQNERGLSRVYGKMGILAAEVEVPNGLERARAYTDTALLLASRMKEREPWAHLHAFEGHRRCEIPQ